MKYQIDQSGKIEHTSKPTIVALANCISISIKISAVEKQRLIKAMKEIEYPKRNYIYKLFAVLIYIISSKKSIRQLEIDKEYPGHESVIKDTLIYLYTKQGITLPEIDFVLVGKKVNCHKAALAVFKESAKPDRIVKAEEIIEVLYGKKSKQKGWRSFSRNDNP